MLFQHSTIGLRARVGPITLRAMSLVFLVFILTLAGVARADVPMRTPPAGAVPNAGTQQQELANITAPAEWNVFEFVVTCGACHGGQIDQHVGHFGNWGGGNMASAARDPVFRANQIGVNNTIKAVTGQDGAGNVCMRCHSPNGWLSGRFDPTMGGSADASNMIMSILASTDAEGIMCETCHRAVGNVTNKRADQKFVKDAQGDDTSVLAKVWNLLAGLFDWEHAGSEPKDQAGTPTVAEGGPLGDTTLQFLDGMSYGGKYSGSTDIYFSDLPIAGTPYTGQIYAVYPDWWSAANGDPMNPVPAGLPETNSLGQRLAYNLDGTLPPLFEVLTGPPVNGAGQPNYSRHSNSIEHPTFGGDGRKTSATDSANPLLPVVPAGNGGSVSPNNFIRSSEFCGSCHELTVPVLNHGMPEQRTYTEWKFSSYSKTTNVIADPLGKRSNTSTVTTGVERCQDCHMPTLKHEFSDTDPGSYNADPVLVGGFPYGKDRAAQGGTAVHKLTGANRWLPQMMKALYAEVDLEVIGAPSGKDPRVFPGMLSDRGPMWDRATQNTEITLRDGLNVQVTQAPTEVVGSPGTYEMKVKVVNKTGHRIPSGYPDGRRFWLSVQAKDATGAPVYTSGFYDEATATLKTTAGDAFKRSLGNIIDATVIGGNAVQVYERVTGLCTSTDSAKNSLILGAPFVYPEPSVWMGADLASCAPSSSLLNNFILFDNRIPPKGLDAVAAREAGVKFWTYDAATFVPTEQTNRYTPAQLAEGSDEVTYRFNAAPGLTLSASAEVLWQTQTREFMEHLRTQDNSVVRPQGPPSPLNLNYPNVPTYLSDSINGQPLSTYTALDGSTLNDNWGGVAYAAWLATGKGAPFLVDRDDTSVTGVPAAPVLTVGPLTRGDDEYIDPVTLAPNSFAAKFSWPAVTGADGYTIWVRYGMSEVTADWDRLAVKVGNGNTSHIEHLFNPGKTYGFKVVAYNGKGETASAVVNHTVASALPAAPNGLTASNAAPGSTGAQITLTWNDNALNEVGFEIWRFGPVTVGGSVPAGFTPPGPLTVIGPAAGGGVASLTAGPATGLNTYVDTTTLDPLACYNYQVRAISANIDVSTWALAPSAGCTMAGAASVNLTATAVSGTRVDLAWTSNATAATGFVVKRNGVQIGTVAKTAATSYTYADLAATPGATITYTVEATGTAAVGTSVVTTPAVPLAPSAVNAVANGIQVTVNWTDNATNEDGFILERAPVVNGTVGAFSPIPGVGAFLPPNTGSYLDASPLEGQTAVYRVKAINLVTGDSAYASSNQVSLGLFAPTNLAGVLSVPPLTAPTANGNVQVTLSWIDVSQKETAYKVERCIGNVVQCASAANWTVLSAALAANTQQFVDATGTATSARTLRYRVTAVRTTPNPTLSSQGVLVVVNVPARSNTPNGLAVADVTTGNNHDTLRVRFSNNSGSPVGYQVARCKGTNNTCSSNVATDADWTVLPPAAGTGTITILDAGLTLNQTYYYAVRSYNAGGWSNWSNRSSATVR